VHRYGLDNIVRVEPMGSHRAALELQRRADGLLAIEGRAAGAAGSMLGSGAIMVMDDTTDIPAAALTLETPETTRIGEDWQRAHLYQDR